MLNVIAQLTPGQQIAMTVLRKSQETKLNITVGKRPPPPKNEDADEE
jgi:serine protease DegQ